MLKYVHAEKVYKKIESPLHNCIIHVHFLVSISIIHHSYKRNNALDLAE